METVNVQSSPEQRPSTCIARFRRESGPVLSLDASFKAGFSLQVPESLNQQVPWDYKGRSRTECQPFQPPRTDIERVWRRPPGETLSQSYKPWNPELGTTSLAIRRTNYPSDSTTFSRVDLLPTQDHLDAVGTKIVDIPSPSISPSISSSPSLSAAARLLTSSVRPSPPNTRPSVIRPPPPPPAIPRPSTAPIIVKNTALQNVNSQRPAALAQRGMDSSIIPTGYRLVERGGSQTFQDVRVAKREVSFKDLALVRQHAEVIKKKDEEWAKKTEQRNAVKATWSSSKGQRDGKEGEETVEEAGQRYEEGDNEGIEMLDVDYADAAARVVAQRSLPRPPPPHPMWKTTYMTLGSLADKAEKRVVFYPRLQSFSNSLQVAGPYRKRGLNCHVDPRPLDAKLS